MSAQQSIELVQVVALQEIGEIIQLCLRLESAFMVEVTSSDLSLLFEARNTVFDSARMTNEFGSAPLGSRDRIVGTTEVGVGKSTSGKAGKGRQMKVLLKAKVVLEKDVV